MEKSLFACFLALFLFSFPASSLSQVCPFIAKPPTCLEITPEYTASLQASYSSSAPKAIGVGPVLKLSVTVGLVDPIAVRGDNSLNSDHVAYSTCCKRCEAEASCIGYTATVRKIAYPSASITNVWYTCRLFTSWSLQAQAPSTNNFGTSFFPAAFARPGTGTDPCPTCPAYSEPACTDDAAATSVSACPSAWTQNFIEGDASMVADQFQCATKDNFEALGNGAVVRGRLLSLGANPSLIGPPIPNQSAQQCAVAAKKAGGTYFTWESCSKSCSVFSNSACNSVNVPNGFSPSSTAFSGVFY